MSICRQIDKEIKEIDAYVSDLTSRSSFNSTGITGDELKYKLKNLFESQVGNSNVTYTNHTNSINDKFSYDGDFKRDPVKPRSQVRELTCGVRRFEAVQVDLRKPMVYVGDGRYVPRDKAVYRNEANNNAERLEKFLTPSLSYDSPHVLLELRPKCYGKHPDGGTVEQTYDAINVDGSNISIVGDEEAKVVLAAPQLLVIGAMNPSTQESNSEATAYKWAGTTTSTPDGDGCQHPLAMFDTNTSSSSPASTTANHTLNKDKLHDLTLYQNVFGVAVGKDALKCWNHAIPVEPLTQPPATATVSPPGTSSTTVPMQTFFGIIGGEQLININGSMSDGLELFGSNAVVLGAGNKRVHESWTSSMILTPNNFTAQCYGNATTHDPKDGFSNLTVEPKKVEITTSLNQNSVSISINATTADEMSMKLAVLEATVMELKNKIMTLTAEKIQLNATIEMNFGVGKNNFYLDDESCQYKGKTIDFDAKRCTFL